MSEYDEYIKAAKDYLHDAHNKMHSDEGIVYALLGIGHILLAQESQRVVYEVVQSERRERNNAFIDAINERIKNGDE